MVLPASAQKRPLNGFKRLFTFSGLASYPHFTVLFVTYSVTHIGCTPLQKIMATSKLIIREQKLNAEGQCVIFLVYRHESKVATFSTGEKVTPADWDAKGQKIRKTYRGHIALNDLLQAQKNRLEALARLAKQQEIEPGVDYIKLQYEGLQHLENAEDDSTQPKRHYLTDVFTEYIKHHEALRSVATIKHYRTSRSHLTKFSESIHKRLLIGDFNMQLNDRYIKYLFGLNMQNNTVGNDLKYLKSFLLWALDTGYHTNVEFRKFKKPTAATDIIYLTKEELDRLLAEELKTHPKLDRVRDLFIFECATGLRFSDLENLNSESIRDNFIEITAIKTSGKLRIPITPMARKILDKYEGSLPKVLTNQKMNDYLKELCERCGITEPIRQVKFIGNRRVEVVNPKFSLVTTHTARRTFITQSLERGLRPEVIMKITGHKDLKTMMRYVKITENVVAEEMLKAWKD